MLRALWLRSNFVSQHRTNNIASTANPPTPHRQRQIHSNFHYQIHYLPLATTIGTSGTTTATTVAIVVPTSTVVATQIVALKTKSCSPQITHQHIRSSPSTMTTPVPSFTSLTMTFLSTLKPISRMLTMTATTSSTNRGTDGELTSS